MTSPLRRIGAPGALGAAAFLLLIGAASAAGQATGTVRGTVSDATTGRPVDGAQVSVVGSDLATLTNAAGQFQLNVPAGEIEFRARRLGYASMSKRVTLIAGQTSEVNYELSQAVVALDAVVVTGTGTETERRKLGNTVATIDVKSLRNAPVATLSEQLAAREPGVAILPSGGLAGEGAQIRIRGSASLTQAAEPLVYVDGIRVNREGGFGDLVYAGGGGSPSRLDDINPESIERIEVLKGAAAATLYGTEASAGVIQIFTKTGSRGAPRWDFLIEQTASRYPIDRYPPQAGFAQYVDYSDCVTKRGLRDSIPCRRTLPVADRLSQFYGEPIQAFQIIEKQFVDRLFETGIHRTISASVSGGTPAVTYYVNGRFQREDGPFGGEDFGPRRSRDFNRKMQGSASIVILPTDNVKIRVNSAYTDGHLEVPENNNNIYAPLTLAIFGKPERATCVTARDTVYDPDGRGGCLGAGNPFGNVAFGTVGEGMQRTNEQDVKHFTGGVNVAYQASPSLSVEGTLGVDVVSQFSAELQPFGYDINGFINNFITGRRAIDNRTRREITAEAKATWKAQFGERWSSVFVAGGQGFIAKMVDEGSVGSAFPGPGLEVTTAGANPFAYERFLETVNAGAFVQEQVGYRDYAFLTVGGRYDRNSAFGKTSEGVFYPKASISVLPSAMPGWANSSLTARVSTLRLRAAIGQSGLQPGAFDKLTTFSPLASELGPGFAPDNLGNPDLRPEVATEWEVGTEIGGFSDRAALDVTYWRRVTRDALYFRQFAPSGGFRDEQLVNIGELRAGGYDVSANVLAVNKPTLSLKLFANVGWMWEFVTDLGDAPPLKVGGSYIRYRNFVREGFAPGSLFGAKLPGPCSTRPAGATYLCLNPGELPYDLTGPTTGVRDGKPDTEAELLAYFAAPRSVDALEPLMVDEDGDGDFLDHYYGKSTPDWQGSFGLSGTVLRNLEFSTLFEYKFGNYLITNLTDAFRKSAPNQRNLRRAAEVEATLLNPASRPEDRLAAARKWAYELKALSPYDGLNQNEKGDFLRWREVSLTYNVPIRWAEQKFGLRYLSLTMAARNLKLWTGYTGIDPELNQYGRGAFLSDLGGIEQNFGLGIDAFGFALPRRYTFTVRMGF